MATEPSSHLDSSSTAASAPYPHPPHSHNSHEAYDNTSFAASTSSTPSAITYPPYLGGSYPTFAAYPPIPYSTTNLAPSTDAHSTRPAMSTSSTSAAPAVFPGIGRIRCYWTILTPQLEYVYLDPTLAYHMGEWSNAFRGSNVLDWVHPDEREQLADDLLPKEDRVAGVESAGVFGSVTRCRYSRLTSILRRLGCQQPPEAAGAEAYALDNDYLNLDITTSWIAGDRKGKGKEGQQGAVLCFFHVTADKDPVQDNDKEQRTEWSNWCGASLEYPSYLTADQCAELVAALKRCVDPSSSSSSSGRPGTSTSDGDKGALKSVLNGGLDDGGPPAHVFQILDTSGRAVVSFPDPGAGPDAAHAVEQFSALAREVMARPREAVQSKTSCTRRYRSKHPVMQNGTLTTVESVVIMYGAITFACFQTGGVYLTSARKAGLSLVTNDLPPDTMPSFALEDVPITPTVGGGGGNMSAKRNLYGDDDEGQADSPPSKRFKDTPLQPPVLPRLQTSTASPNGSSGSPRSSDPHGHPHQQHQQNGLSISTNGRMFGSRLDVDSITAGGISPTVASASAILGSLGGESHAPDAGQQRQQPQQPQQRPAGGSPSSYAAFYNAQAPPHSGGGHASFFPGSHSPYGQPHALPHPLSQSHSGYFPTAPQSPHEPAGANSGLYPPTSQPFDQQQHQPQHQPQPPPQQQQQQHQAFGAANPSPTSAFPPPPPLVDDDGEQSHAGDSAGSAAPADAAKKVKKPPKQRPDGPVYKPNQKACESCGTVNSPEWRKGPTGAKSLCNACGLRYARSVARQKKQAEAAANGGPPPKKSKKKATAAAQKLAALEAAGDSSSTGTPGPAASLPPGSQPLPGHSPITSAAYDLSAFTHAPHSAPKPYTPYYASAPQLPSPYSHAPSPTMTHTPQYSSPGVGGPTAPSYFPPMGYPSPYGAGHPPPPPQSAPHPGMPSMPTHASLPPLSHAAGSAYDYARARHPPPPPAYPHHGHPHSAMHSPHLEQGPPGSGHGSSGPPSSVGMYASHSSGGGGGPPAGSPHLAQGQQQQQQQHYQQQQQQHHWSPHDPPYGHHPMAQQGPPPGGHFNWATQHSAEQRGPSDGHGHQHGGQRDDQHQQR
ncbi:hypothetical protein JCM3775_005344 [Rhodotorula graminis]